VKLNLLTAAVAFGLRRFFVTSAGIVGLAALAGSGLAADASGQKAILITGASSGFGRAATDMLASQGYFVYAGARKPEDVAALNAIKNVKALRLDVTVQADIDAAVAQVKADGRGLFGLVNNAGVAILFPLTEVDETDLKYLLDVNVWGPYRVTKAFAPLLVASKGRVVNLSSISGIFAAPLLGPYSMSKHAMEAFSDALRGEMGKAGVTVATIEPGNFATEIGQTAYERMRERGQTYAGSPFEEAAVANMERLRLPQGKEGPERVAKAIVEALTSPTPKPRSLVVSNQRDAEVTIRSQVTKLAQLNQGHEFGYSRDQLVAMLDEALTGPKPVADAEKQVVSGQASYRERIALPPDAVFEATLEDVSRPGAMAEVLGSVRIEKAGPVPIRFEIPYDPAKIDERHSYAVRARILRGDRLLFTTDTVHPVLTRGAGTSVELLLVRSRTKVTPQTSAPLEGTHWALVELSGKPVPAGLPQEAYLEFQADPRRVSGSGGCNRLTGDYERDGDRLSFKPLAGTRRACIGGGMDTEDAFLTALPKARAFRIAGPRLELVDDGGRAVAAFEAREPTSDAKP